MSRSVPEWIGKTDDSKPPRSVRLRVFHAHGGICHVSGRKITACDLWELDHVVSLGNGGGNRETNLAPALKDKHREKTTRDVQEQRRAERRQMKQLGIKKPSTLSHPNLVRGFDGKVRPRQPRESSHG